ncbi:carph-isopro domain-containing protein [Kaistia adipata]|uniref:carph-isopro domain-containing protein n=1 Tax=Kaistia adipata TaxID=166954 RepID=UPI0003FF692E|nr:hypothetical protein [Kaistia adipata]
MNTIGDLIDAFGGNTKFAAVIGKNVSTASEMKRRDSIPIDYWPLIIQAAAERGMAGIDADRLMKLHLKDSS